MAVKHKDFEADTQAELDRKMNTFVQSILRASAISDSVRFDKKTQKWLGRISYSK